MYKLFIKDNIKFSKISKDYNPIHISKKHSNKFFFKYPILHGANVSKLLLEKYVRKYNFKNISSLEVHFVNYIHAGEKFSISIQKRKIVAMGEFNKKTICNIEFKKQEGIQLKLILKELNFISSFVANKFPGKLSLIHKISFFKDSYNIQKDRLIKKRNLNKNIVSLKYNISGVAVEVIASKLVPFVSRSKVQILPKKVKDQIKDSKILIFGKNSDIGNYVRKTIGASGNINYMSLRDKTSVLINSSHIVKKIKTMKPNFIFFFSSPNVFHGNNEKLYRLYKKIYYFYPKIILKAIYSLKINCYLFYPSSIALTNPKLYPYLTSYILAKKRGETLRKNKEFGKFIKIYRLPQIKSRSNYSIFGKYEGKDIITIRKYIINFLLAKSNL